MPDKDEKYDDQTILGDEYDVYGKTITVHSKRLQKFGLNEDFKLSDLSKNNQILVRRSLVLMRHIISYLDYTRMLTSNKKPFLMFNGQKIKTKGVSKGITVEEMEKVDEIAVKIVRRMMDDLSALAVLSSAHDGRIIKAIVKRMRHEEEKPEEKETLGDKLKPEKKEESMI